MKRHLGVLTCVVLLPATLGGQAPGRTGAVEGQAIETRPTEKKDNAPTFPEQTRAPSRKTTPYTVTTLVDTLEAPWALAFLPGGKMLVTERLPGRMRFLDANGTLSKPLAGVNVVASPTSQDIGLLDVAEIGRAHV